MVSGRLGRKTYKEQYAFIYRQVSSAGTARPSVAGPQHITLPSCSMGTGCTSSEPRAPPGALLFHCRQNLVSVKQTYQYPDTQPGDEDAFSREPFVVWFQSPKTGGMLSEMCPSAGGGAGVGNGQRPSPLPQHLPLSSPRGLAALSCTGGTGSGAGLQQHGMSSHPQLGLGARAADAAITQQTPSDVQPKQKLFLLSENSSGFQASLFVIHCVFNHYIISFSFALFLSCQRVRCSPSAHHTGDGSTGDRRAL